MTLRVLHVISEMGIGGAEAVVVELVRGGAEVGWASAVASGGGARADLLAAEGVPVFAVPPARRSVGGLVAAIRATRGAVREFAPDLVIAHNVSATAVAKMARPGVPILSVFHGVAEGDYRNAARVLRRLSDHVIAVADAIAGRLRDAGLRNVGLSVVRNAVTAPAPTRSRADSRAEFGIASGTPVALCLARMVPQKRHDVLIDAWRQVADGVLLLAGDGPDRAALEERARDLGDRVRFLGRRGDIGDLLEASDLTVLASDWEGLPIAVLESMAAGRPVVATDVDGLREALGNGGGRLVPPRDPAALAAALSELLTDHDARETAAKQGLTTIANAYNPGLMLRSYDDLARGIIDA